MRANCPPRCIPRPSRCGRLNEAAAAPRGTGPGEPQIVRMHDEQLEVIDDWIEAQGEKISRPEAIRRLVEIGLNVKAR